MVTAASPHGLGTAARRPARRLSLDVEGDRYITRSLSLAAYLAAVGIEPAIRYSPRTGTAEYVLPASTEVEQACVEWYRHQARTDLDTYFAARETLAARTRATYA